MPLWLQIDLQSSKFPGWPGPTNPFVGSRGALIRAPGRRGGAGRQDAREEEIKLLKQQVYQLNATVQELRTEISRLSGIGDLTGSRKLEAYERAVADLQRMVG